MVSRQSEKPAVIDRIFDTLWDEESGKLKRTVVTNEDVVGAIEWCRDKHGLQLSSKNPANFIKDIIRGRGASRMWPERLKEMRISARQVTGAGKIFEFVDYEPGQTDAFPERFGYHPEVKRHKIQSVSMPLASKELGRDDETYLIQVAVKLAVVETHFAITSPINVVELNHLQIGIKLRLVELDSLFSAKEEVDGEILPIIITAEAKKRNQRILEDQIVRQVKAAFAVTKVNSVVPIAMTSAGNGIYIAEFKRVSRQEIDTYDTLTLETEALYELIPRVKGI